MLYTLMKGGQNVIFYYLIYIPRHTHTFMDRFSYNLQYWNPGTYKTWNQMGKND